ncbi:hypothetical protein J7399_11670 [Shimia sp. R9_1]|uniref:hypothetical protein n=1 Tax=Shimia sp. R9_1 TaxID=2821111 RepID=UPI001ADC2B4A|nr:hypothetical protein [Shimia sp. R9_1]MBO9408090.1 hypothetical protein [Shimia sp. R9_1]
MISVYQNYRTERELKHLESVSVSGQAGELKLIFSALLIALILATPIVLLKALVGETGWYPALQFLLTALIAANFFLDFKVLWVGKRSSSTRIGQRIQELQQELSK